MNIILKYKKSFIVVLIIAGVLTMGAIIPFGIMDMLSVKSSSETYAVPDDINERITSRVTGVTYEIENLKTDNSIKYPKQELFLGEANLSSAYARALAPTRLEIAYEGYLKKGMNMNISFEVESTQSGTYSFIVINEDGIVEEFQTDSVKKFETSVKVNKSGNYAMIIYPEDAEGTFRYKIEFKRQLFGF